MQWYKEVLGYNASKNIISYVQSVLTKKSPLNNEHNHNTKLLYRKHLLFIQRA